MRKSVSAVAATVACAGSRSPVAAGVHNMPDGTGSSRASKNHQLGPLEPGDTLTIQGEREWGPPAGASVDVYSFSIAAATSVSLRLDVLGQDSNPALSLFDQSGTLLAMEHDSGHQHSVLLTMALAAGTYCLAVSGSPDLDFSGCTPCTSLDWRYRLAISAAALESAPRSQDTVAGAEDKANRHWCDENIAA